MPGDDHTRIGEIGLRLTLAGLLTVQRTGLQHAL